MPRDGKPVPYGHFVSGSIPNSSSLIPNFAVRLIMNCPTGMIWLCHDLPGGMNCLRAFCGGAAAAGAMNFGVVASGNH